MLRSTSCPMDCPDCCALQVEVGVEVGEEAEEGRVLAIGGRRDHPDTAGFICTKVAHFGRRLDGPERLLFPQRRVGPKGEGQFERISWEVAIAEIAERLLAVREQHGGESILPFHYGGSNGALTDGFLDRLFFERLGTARLDKTICAAPTSAVATEMYGKMVGVAFADYVEAELILLWGANPRASNIHLMPYLREARRRGARIVQIDPRRTLGDADLDLHLAVRPGSDLPLALALVRGLERRGAVDGAFLARHADDPALLFAAAAGWTPERAAAACGVPAAAIERLIDLYAASSPAVIRCGWGLERNRNGGRAAAVILALAALAGKFGVRGGGYTLSNSGAQRVDAVPLLGLEETAALPRRTCGMTGLAADLAPDADPGIAALFVYNANPAATVPDQNRLLAALAREDLFTVVHEQVMTDTALFADLLLPATTFLEHHDLRAGYGSLVYAGVVPVIEPRGEAWSNHRLFAALGQACGFDDPAFFWGEAEAQRRLAAAVARPGGPPDIATIAAGGCDPLPLGDGRPVQFVDVLPATPDGRIRLVPPVLGEEPYAWDEAAAEGGAPLALITPATERTISSTMGEYDTHPLELRLHPEDAAARRLEDGAAVRVFNELGEVHCRARVDGRLRPGVVSLPKGSWRRHAANGSTATALCPAHEGTAGGACFNDARVEVEALAATADELRAAAPETSTAPGEAVA